MIAVDWGTTNFRAFRLGPHGAILDRRFSPKGILSTNQRDFAGLLCAEVGSWLRDGDSRILLCGMIGSRQGWVETPYVPCPVSLDDLVEHIVPVKFDHAEVRLIPGVSGPDANGTPEVMRGEETETIGVLELHSGISLMCFPGTHSKWIHLQDRRIASFTTAMTGDFYSAMRQHTILRSMMSPGEEIDLQAFARGVRRSADAGGLLHHLFGVRTLALTGQLTEAESSSYLSGLLIGHDVRSAITPGAHVHLVGAAHLCFLYSQAIELCGGTTTIEDEDAAARGLAAIGKRMHWI